MVGFLTDGPIFLVTLALWIPASKADRFMNRTDEEIMASLGDAFIPRGGEFEIGYLDLLEECLRDAGRMFEAQHGLARGVT